MTIISIFLKGRLVITEDLEFISGTGRYILCSITLGFLWVDLFLYWQAVYIPTDKLDLGLCIFSKETVIDWF